MATHARGLICLALTDNRCKQLNLEMMVKENTTSHGTAFTTSIDSAKGITTGISASDRSKTILDAVNKTAKPSEGATDGKGKAAKSSEDKGKATPGDKGKAPSKDTKKK